MPSVFYSHEVGETERNRSPLENHLVNGLCLEEDKRKFTKANLKENFSPIELRRENSESGFSMDHEKRL